MQSPFLKTLAVLGLLATTPLAVAQEQVPTTVAQGWDQINAAVADGTTLYYAAPPSNVRAEHYRALFGDTVMISWAGIHFPGTDGIKIIFIGGDGRYVWCSRDDQGRFTAQHEWRAELRRQRSGALVPIFNPAAPTTSRGGLSPLYDGQTGGVIWYTYGDGYWWDWNRGHIQERLPAATWTLCPDFPSAASLGVGVNQAQTATSYEALLAQDPGRRILRPELVTPNVAELYE